MKSQACPVAGFYGHINARDFAGLSQCLSPHWIDHTASGPNSTAQFIDVVRGVLDAIPDLHIAIVEKIECGSHTVIRGQMSGTHSGVLFGSQATGKPLQFRTHDIHRVENGLIIESWQLEDWIAVWETIRPL